MVKLSKRKYLEQYGSIKNKNIVIEEVKNKPGQIYYSANRMVATCTVRCILQQASQQGITVSHSTVLSLCPFFITFATEKAIALCLFKVCLNTRMLFEPLMAQAKRDNDHVTESLTEFFIYSCECLKLSNWYYQWNCVFLKCKDCKNSKSILLECQNSEKNPKWISSKPPRSSTKKMIKMARLWKIFLGRQKELNIHWHLRNCTRD